MKRINQFRILEGILFYAFGFLIQGRDIFMVVLSILIVSWCLKMNKNRAWIVPAIIWSALMMVVGYAIGILPVLPLFVIPCFASLGIAYTYQDVISKVDAYGLMGLMVVFDMMMLVLPVNTLRNGQMMVLLLFCCMPVIGTYFIPLRRYKKKSVVLK